MPDPVRPRCARVRGVRRNAQKGNKGEQWGYLAVGGEEVLLLLVGGSDGGGAWGSEKKGAQPPPQHPDRSRLVCRAAQGGKGGSPLTPTRRRGRTAEVGDGEAEGGREGRRRAAVDFA